MSETTAPTEKPPRARALATLIGGVVLGIGLLLSRISSADGKPSHETPPPSAQSTMSAPAMATVHPGAWTTTAQLEQLKAELTAEIRGYRGDVAGALKQLEQTTSRLHGLEIEQAEQRGEQRARTAGYRR